MKIFNSIGHAFAWILSKIVPAANAVEAVVQSPIGQALAGLVPSKGPQVQADIEAVAGSVVAFATSTGAALSSEFLNGALDAAALAALERLISTVGSAFGKPAPAAAAKA